MMLVRTYQVMGVLILLWLGWADHRGWTYGTLTPPQCARPGVAADAQANLPPCATDRSIRNRSYRGGK
jgi:hypothetical protein